MSADGKPRQTAPQARSGDNTSGPMRRATPPQIAPHSPRRADVASVYGDGPVFRPARAPKDLPPTSPLPASPVGRAVGQPGAGSGGVGGVCTSSGTLQKGEGEGSTFASLAGEGTGTVPVRPQETGTGFGAVRAAIRDAGCWLLAPSRGDEVAHRLVAAGLTAEDVRAIAEYVRDREPTEDLACRYVAAVLAAGGEEVRRALADLRDWSERRRRNPQKQEPGRAIRERDMERVRRFEAEWQAARATGAVNPRARDPHPWEIRHPLIPQQPPSSPPSPQHP